MYTIGLRKLNQERHWSWLLSLKHSTGNSRVTRLLIAHSSIVDDVWNLGGCQDLWNSRKSRPGSVGRWWIFATWKRHLKPTHPPPGKSSSSFCWVDFSLAMKQKKTNRSLFFGEDVRILGVDVSFFWGPHLMKPSPWVPRGNSDEEKHLQWMNGTKIVSMNFCTIQMRWWFQCHLNKLRKLSPN